MTLLVSTLICVYTLTNAGRFHIVDEVSLFAVTESVGLRGDVDTNAIAWTQWVNSPGEVLGAFGPDGQVYSKKGPAPAFLALPWYLLWLAVARLGIGVGLLQATLLWNGIVTALTAALLWGTTVRLGYNDRVGLVLGLLFGLGTIAWPYANHFFGEPLSALSLLACFYGLLAWSQDGRRRWMWLAGSAGGVALATVTAHGVLIAILVGYGLWCVRRRWEEGISVRHWLALGLAFGAPLALAGLVLLAYNFLRFGNPLDTGYHFDQGEGFTTPILQGAWGLLLSPYRGVFWHTPLLVAGLAAWPAFWRRHRAEATLIAALSLALVGLYSTWWMWWGGFAWGPRFLVPLTPFWCLPLAVPLAGLDVTLRRWQARRRRMSVRALRPLLAALGGQGLALAAVAGLSVVVQLLAVSLNYVNYEIQLRSIFPTDWSDPLRFGPPAQGMGDFLDSPVFGQLRLWGQGFVANTDLAWLRADGTVLWLVVWVGAAALVTLAVGMGLWWRGMDAPGGPALPSRPARILVLLVPLVLMGTWLGEAGQDPHYGQPDRGYRAALASICAQEKSGDALITVAPFAYQVPMNWLGGLCREALPIFGYAANSMEHPEAQQVLGQVLASSRRIWFITGGLPANAPENTVERWLSQHAYKAIDLWYDDYRLLSYATPPLLAQAPVHRLDVTLTGPEAGPVQLLTVRAPGRAVANDVIPVELTYQLLQPVNRPLRWFVQLLGPDGVPVALLDTAPDDGYASFSGLPEGEALTERAGLQLPTSLPPGSYTLIAGLYDPEMPAAAQRLRTPAGGDFVVLGNVVVQ